MSEIIAVPGVTAVGPIPAANRNDTVHAGAVSVAASDPEAARALLDRLAGPQGQAGLEGRGMRTP